MKWKKNDKKWKKWKKKKRMCVLFSIIECVYWCLRITWLSMFVDRSSYVSFLRPSMLCIHFIIYFESEMNDLLLGALGHCLFHHYVHCWCDFTPCLIWVDHYSSLCYLFHHHPRFRFWFIIFTSCLIRFLQQPISGLMLFSHHHYTYHYQFILLHLSPHRHHIHVRHSQVHGSRDLLYMLHFIYEGMGFWSLGI